MSLDTFGVPGAAAVGVPAAAAAASAGQAPGGEALASAGQAPGGEALPSGVPAPPDQPAPPPWRRERPRLTVEQQDHVNFNMNARNRGEPPAELGPGMRLRSALEHPETAPPEPSIGQAPGGEALASAGQAPADSSSPTSPDDPLANVTSLYVKYKDGQHEHCYSGGTLYHHHQHDHTHKHIQHVHNHNVHHHNHYHNPYRYPKNASNADGHSHSAIPTTPPAVLRQIEQSREREAEAKVEREAKVSRTKNSWDEI